MCGFVLSCGVIVIINIFDGSVKNEESLEKAIKLRTLVKLQKNDLNLDDKFK